MRFFVLLCVSSCLLAVALAHQSGSLRQERHTLRMEQPNIQRQERGTFRSPNSNMDQNPDKGQKVKRGVSRFGEAPIERELTGNTTPAESPTQSPLVAGVPQPYAGAAQPYAGVAQPYAQNVAAVPAVQPVVGAVPAVAAQPVAAVGRKKRGTLLAVEVGKGPGQS